MKPEKKHPGQAQFLARLAKMLPGLITVEELPTRKIIYCNNENSVLSCFYTAEASFGAQKELTDAGDLKKPDAYYDFFTPATTDEDVQSFQYNIKDKAGEWLRFLVRGRVFERNTDGSIRSILTITENITSREKAGDGFSQYSELLETGKRSEQKLKDQNESLERRVQKRTKELIYLKINQEKEKMNAIIFAQERERSRIGEGLHNGVVQLLYATQNRLQLLSPMKGKDAENFELASKILLDAIVETRKISFEIMPPVLRDFGLEASLRALVQKVFLGHINVRLSISLKKRPEGELEISIYRIVQEAMNNIMKHAGATEAVIEIQESKKALSVMISDNGKGFLFKDAEKRRKGIGLQTIENRVALLNGDVKFKSAAGKGTTVAIRIPL